MTDASRQHPRQGGRRRLLPAAVLLSSLVACGSSSPQDAFGGAGTRVSTCVPVPGGSPVLFADEVLRNEGDDPVTVDDVRLVDPDGVTLLDAFLLPVQDRTLLGTTALPPDSPVWAERREAVGAAVDPGQTWNLALSLGREARAVSFADVEVRYTVDGDAGAHRLAWALTVVPAATCPADAGT